MATESAGAITAVQVLEGLRERRDQIVDAYMRELLPSYQRSEDRRLGDMRETAERIIELLLQALAAGRAEGRAITSDDWSFAQAYVRHALLRGAREAELLRAARTPQRPLWEAMTELAGDDGGALVARLSPPLIEYLDAMSEGIIQTGEEFPTTQDLTARAGRRELVEDLLAGNPVAPGIKRDAARACGLRDRSRWWSSPRFRRTGSLTPPPDPSLQ